MAHDVVFSKPPSFDELISLFDGKRNRLSLWSDSVIIPVHPAYLMDVKRGIRLSLEAFLLKYNEKMAGVILAFDPSFKMESSHGFISYDDPSPYYNITVDFISFNAKIGDKIIGKVMKIGTKHIMAVTHDIIQSSIVITEDIPADVLSSIHIGMDIYFVILEIKLINNTVSFASVLSSSFIKKISKLNEKNARELLQNCIL